MMVCLSVCVFVCCVCGCLCLYLCTSVYIFAPSSDPPQAMVTEGMEREAFVCVFACICVGVAVWVSLCVRVAEVVSL